MTAHVDTSLMVEQQKSEKEATRVRSALAVYKFRSSSTFARKEYKRSWLQDLAYLHKLSKDAADLGDLIRLVERKLGMPVQSRRRKRCQSAIAAYISKQPGELPVSALMTRFRAHVAEAVLGGYMSFNRSVHHVFDGTGCVRGNEEPTLAANDTLDTTVRTCKSNSIRCTVHSFFESNRKEFDKIDAAIIAAGDDVSG